jgi:predicted TIM-barrel fold metal-dependent hydrolase
MDRFIVVSSDCHAGLPPAKYRDYLDPQYREAFDQALPIQLEMTKKAESRFLIKEINDDWRKDIAQELTGAWDHAQRIKMLDNDGIAGEIIFPDGITENNAGPFGASLGLPTKDIVPELQWAGTYAHNRWLSEFCQNAPERHFGVAMIPVLWDVQQAVEHVRWCVDNGLRSVMIPHLIGDKDHYHHPKYDPFWEVCESLNVVINFHSGATPVSDYFGKSFPEDDGVEYKGAMGVFVTEVMWWTYRPLAFLIWGGVFERFPKLRVAVTEAGTAWMLPSYLRMIDHNYHELHFSAKLGDFHSHLSMAPSEYFKRNVRVGASCMPRADTEIRHQIGLQQIMWGSDYPHPEGTWPQTERQLFDTFHDLPEAEIGAMLGENAIEFYGFDRNKLAQIAARIGPEKSRFQTGSVA